MSNNSKLTLRYSQYQPILDDYLSLPEFDEKASETMRGKRVVVISLCNYLGDVGITNFDACTPKDVTSYLTTLANLSSSTKSGKLFILRHFFNYLFSNKYITFSGSELFPVIVSNKRERILSFYSGTEVKKVISHVNNTTPKGKRDLLVVLLAAELGIRSGDICRLKLSDIHWERNTIEFIQFKTNVFNQLPLLVNIKFALIDYIKNARPSCQSELLFIGVKNNYQMISTSQMHSIVSKYFSVAGIDISNRKHGPHALRHSLASNLLINNTPMHVIKDVLGHTNLNTTRIYLNIDFNTLRKFALEVPYESNN